jgi:hypothetical protein
MSWINCFDDRKSMVRFTHPTNYRHAALTLTLSQRERGRFVRVPKILSGRDRWPQEYFPRFHSTTSLE